MRFQHTEQTLQLISKLDRFMDEYIYPNEETYADQMTIFRNDGIRISKLVLHFRFS